jgi:hypothetical protein
MTNEAELTSASRVRRRLTDGKEHPVREQHSNDVEDHECWVVRIVREMVVRIIGERVGCMVL